jgi:hypothetical protein
MREGGMGRMGELHSPEELHNAKLEAIAEINKRRAELGGSMADYMENGVGDKETFERERKELDELDAALKLLEGKG